MDLTTAKKAEVTAALEAVRDSFNKNIGAPVNAISAALKAAKDSTLSPDIQDCIDQAFNPVTEVLNAAIAPLHAAIAANLARVPVDPPVTTTPPLFANDLSSVAVIQRDFWHADAFYNPGPKLPTVDNPTVWINGMLQVPIVFGLNSLPGQGGTGASWHWWMPANIMAMQELWAEYDFMIDPDVPAGFNEEGCKLPGLAGAWEQPGQWAEPSGSKGWFSARLWHRRPDAAGNCEFAGYVYSARSMDAGNPFGEIIGTGKMLQPGVKYKLGQHIKLNSRDAAGNWLSDGIFEMLLDGVVVFSDTAFKMRADPRATFQDFFINIFHGGSQPVKAPIHYRIGGIIVDNKPIPWKPPVIIDTGPPVPAWRKGLKVGVWTEGIPMTWGLEIDPFSGMASDRVNAMIYWPGPGGHAIGDGAPVYGLDLMADKLAIKTLLGTHLIRARTSVDNLAYWPDGEPTGAHLYYNGVVPIINGKPVVVRTLNSAAAYGSAAPPRTDAYHPDRNGWDLNGQGWGVPPTPSFESCVALDRRTNLIYTANSGNGWGILDANTGQWTRLPNGDKSPGWSGSVIDPRRGQHLFTRDDGSLGGRDLVTGVFATYASTVRCRAMVIQERFNRLFTIGYDSVFRGINLDTFAITDMGAVPQPSTVYNRIEDFPTLGGLLHLPGYGQPARFFATE